MALVNLNNSSGKALRCGRTILMRMRVNEGEERGMPGERQDHQLQCSWFTDGHQGKLGEA